MPYYNICCVQRNMLYLCGGIFSIPILIMSAAKAQQNAQAGMSEVRKAGRQCSVLLEVGHLLS